MPPNKLDSGHSDEEEQVSKMNRTKVEEHWRNVLRREKLESFQNELSSLQSCHEEEVLRIDAVHSRAEKGFYSAEEQYRSAYVLHLQRIDELTELYKEGLLHMERDFADKLDFLRHDYSSEMEAMTEQHEHKKQRLLNQISELSATEEKLRLRDERTRHQAMEEVKGRNLEEVNNLRFVLDGKIEDLGGRCEAEELEYLSKNDHKAVDVADLSAKDSRMKREIEDLVRRVDKLQGAFTRVKAASRRNQQQRAEKNLVLTEKKSTALEQYQCIKGKMDHNRESQYSNIVRLTERAKLSKGDLQNKHDLAERILKLLHVAGTMEADEGDVKDEGGKGSDSVHVDLVDEANKKLSKALIGLEVQDKQLRVARKENLALRVMLKNFEDGTSLNDDVIRNGNPLFIVNGRLVDDTKNKCNK